MKTNFKKVSSIIMAATMLLSAAPLSKAVRADFNTPFTAKASAAGTVDPQGTEQSESKFTYLCVEKGVYLISGEGTYPGYADPNSELYSYKDINAIIFDDNVTAIGENAFKNSETLNVVYFGENVKYIGRNAFYGCIALEGAAFAETEEQSAQIVIESGNEILEAAEIEYEYNTHGKLTDTISYRINEITGTLTISGTGDMPNLLEDGSPFIKSGINKIVIENGITSVGSGAFVYCEDLETVEIAGSVKKIDCCAFVYCHNIKSVKIKNGTESIESGAFFLCGIEKFEIPASVTSMPVPEDEDIGDIAVSNPCLASLVKEYSVDADNPNYSSEDGVLFNKDKTILYAYPAGNENTYYSVPYGVQTIAAVSFVFSRNLYEVYIPDTVKTIGTEAFEFCENLSRVDIGDNVTDIGVNAFHSCNNLKDVYFFGSDEAWKEITIGENNDALYDAQLHTNIVGYLSENVKWVYDAENKGLIIKGTGSTPDYAESPFQDFKYDVDYITFDKGITRVGDNLFNGFSQVTEVEFGSDVTEIGKGAFENCNNLLGVGIENNKLKKIDVNAFNGCDAYTGTSFEGTVEDWRNIVIERGNDCIKNSYFEIYKSDVDADGWLSNSVYYNFDEETGTLTISGLGTIAGSQYIKDSYFYRNNEIRHVVFEDGITSIGRMMFYQCGGIESVEIADSVKIIDEYAFCLCNGSENGFVVTGGSGIEKIGNYAFAFSGVTQFTLPEGLKTIGEGAFTICRLKNVNIPASVTEIGKNALLCGLCCESINVDTANKYYASKDGVLYTKDMKTLIQYPASMVDENQSLNLKPSFTVPDSVERIETGACVAAEEICFGENIRYIGEDSVIGRTIWISAEDVEFSRNESSGKICSFDNAEETHFIVKSGSKTEETLRNEGLDCIAYSVRQENGKKVIAFNGRTTVEDGADYQYITYAINQNPGTAYVYFETLELNGVETDSIPASLKSNVTSVDGSTTFNNVYVLANVSGKKLTFETLKNAVENGTLSTYVKLSVPAGNPEPQKDEKTTKEKVADFIKAVFDFFFGWITRK